MKRKRGSRGDGEARSDMVRGKRDGRRDSFLIPSDTVSLSVETLGICNFGKVISVKESEIVLDVVKLLSAHNIPIFLLLYLFYFLSYISSLDLFLGSFYNVAYLMTAIYKRSACGG
jgi:hypothetical protein